MAKAKSKATAKPKYKYELRQGKELDIYEDLPAGWKVDHGAMTAPVGTVMITNGGSLFGKNGLPRRQNALLISNKEWFEEDTLKSVKKIKSSTAPTKAKSAPKPAVQVKEPTKSKKRYYEKEKERKAVAPAAKAVPSAPTFTVMVGRKSKTFATKAEAKAYEKQCRKKTGKKYEIRESKKKPSHKVVSFTAKSK